MERCWQVGNSLCMSLTVGQPAVFIPLEKDHICNRKVRSKVVSEATDGYRRDDHMKSDCYRKLFNR